MELKICFAEAPRNCCHSVSTSEEKLCRHHFVGSALMKQTHSPLISETLWYG